MRSLRLAGLLVSIAAIGWVDYASGPDIGFSIFYLVPVVVAGFFDGVVAAVITAITASIAWIVADYLWAETPVGVTAWNGFTRLAIFTAMGVTMAALRTEREKLRRAIAELEAFSYSVSHDLRSPVTHVQAYAGMLLKRSPSSLDEVTSRYIRTISEAAQSALNLIDNLLAFSRLERAAMQRSRVDLGAVVAQIRDDLTLEAGARRVEWRVGSLPWVVGDAPMLQLALQNLLSNAVKYTRRKDQAVIEVGSFERDGEDVIFVRDNGVGFDPKYKQKLFQAFERLHSSSEFEGSGIGLATVARIVSRHGGRTWAEGELDRGATFYLSLPREVMR